MNRVESISGELSEWPKVQHSKSRWRKSTAMPYSPYFKRFSAMRLVSNSRSSNTNSNTFVISGELSEWSKVQHSKCCVLTKHPGFESLTLRQQQDRQFCLRSCFLLSLRHSALIAVNKPRIPNKSNRVISVCEYLENKLVLLQIFSIITFSWSIPPIPNARSKFTAHAALK